MVLGMYILVAHQRPSSAFNLPSLSGQELVLSFEVIAAIYENRLTMWNDYRIKELNSKNVSDSLPAESIIVVTTSAVSANTQLFTLAISQSVSNFTVPSPPPSLRSPPRARRGLCV
jgi:ABC-type phosphate transport system substrate-binding protein